MQTQPAVCIARGGTKRQKIRSLAAQGFGDCQKTTKKSWNTEQQGKSEGGKEPPSRSINQFSELFQSSENCLSGAKRLFRHADALLVILQAARLYIFPEMLFWQ